MPAVALRDRDDEAQVRVDHVLLRRDVAALDSLRERNLLGRREQLVAAHLREEELQRVGGGRQLERVVEVQLVVGVVLTPQLDTALGERKRQLVQVVLAQLVSLGERLEIARVHIPKLLAGVEQGLDIVLVQNRSNGAAPFRGLKARRSRVARGRGRNPRSAPSSASL